ncbi:MAG: glycosyltransferase [Candidatus Ancillula sp.]|jgi:glycosyltransferase involved in cell wall biosynthesis|nr:glycosyltransferase [Candidatus Ancillula sp.]
MLKEIFVSCIMCTYDEDVDLVKQAITSIVNQVQELIIVADDPTNLKLLDFLLSEQQIYKNIKLIQNETNLGVVKSTNRAIDNLNSSAKYVAIMDADDVAKPTRIQEEVRIMEENQNFAALSCVGDLIIESENNKQEIRPMTLHMPKDPQVVNQLLPIRNIVSNPGAIIRANIIKKYRYRELDKAQDYDFWMRLIKDGQKIAITNQNLIQYRIHQNSHSHSNYYRTQLSDQFIKEQYKKSKDFLTATSEEIVSRQTKYNSEHRLNNVSFVKKVNKAFSEFEEYKNKKNLFLMGLTALSWTPVLKYQLMLIKYFLKLKRLK